MIPTPLRKDFNRTIAVLLGVLIALAPFWASGQTLTPTSGEPPEYSIACLAKTGDILPKTTEPETITEEDISEVSVYQDQLFLRTLHGIFVATKDTLLPLMTSLEGVPAVPEDCTEEFMGHMLDMWRGSVHFALWRSQHMHIAGPQSAVFVRPVCDEMKVYSATPGSVKEILSGKKTPAIRGMENDVPHFLGYIRDFHVGKRQVKPVASVLWYGDPPKGAFLKGYESSLFAFDGEKVETLAAYGDSIIGRESTLSCVGVRPYQAYYRQVAWDGSCSRSFFVGEDASESYHYQLFLSDSGRVYPIVRDGQALLDGQGMTYGKFNAHTRWHADFSRSRVFLFGEYSMGGNTYEGFLAASRRGMERIAEWKSGDTLPNTGGGIIDDFGGYLIRANDNEVIAWVSIDDSDRDVEHGIFSCKGNATRKLVAQGDAAPAVTGGTFSKFSQFAFADGENGVVVLADIEGGNAKQGIFLVSGGQISKLIADGDTATFKTKSGRRAKLPLLGIDGFWTAGNGKLVLRGSYEGGKGCFLAVPRRGGNADDTLYGHKPHENSEGL